MLNLYNYMYTAVTMADSHIVSSTPTKVLQLPVRVRFCSLLPRPFPVFNVTHSDLGTKLPLTTNPFIPSTYYRAELYDVIIWVTKQEYSGTSDSGLFLLRTQHNYIKDKISCPKLYFYSLLQHWIYYITSTHASDVVHQEWSGSRDYE